MNTGIPATPPLTPDSTARAPARRRVTDLFTREEIAQLTARSDLMGFYSIFSAWAVIAATFAVLAAWPNAFTYIAALCVIAGRQLALAILTHEGAHGTLFRTRWLNDVFTDWVCARPIWNDLHKYRTHHLVHHTKTGTDEDSDISLVAGMPTTRASLARKLLRDLVGITGLKFFVGRVLMDAGVLKYTVASAQTRLPQDGRHWHDYVLSLARNLGPALVANGVLFAIFAAFGKAWLYGAWVLAYVTPFPFFLRIRSLAEHACTEKSPDMFLNTRTTRANWLARATVAPFRVHYHIEHHVMASVPWYRLPAMHRLLRARGAVGAPPGYLDVLTIVSSRRNPP